MAGTYLPAKALDLATAAVNAVTGIEAYQGRKTWDDSEDVERDVRGLVAETQGRMWLWISSRQGPGPSWQPFNVVLKGELLLRLDTHVASACDLLYDKVEEVAAELEDATTFTSVPAVPMGVSWESSSDSPEDGVTRFMFTMNYRVGPNC